MSSVGVRERVASRLPRLGSIARRSFRRSVRGAQRIEARVAPSLTVLAYHRVAEPVIDPWDLSVSSVHFDEQVQCVKAAGDIVPLGHGLERFRTSRQRQFAITFDDGYVDNLHAALPILERHDVCATVFIPTGFIDAPAFWWDRLDRIVTLDECASAELGEALVDAGLARSWARSPDGVDRRTFQDRLHEDVTALDRRSIEVGLDRVVDRLGLDETGLDGRPMTTAELMRFAEHPLITIGAHTATHRMLPKLDDAAVSAELEAGSSALDSLLGPDERVLAYPHGRTDQRIERLVRRGGFRHALTTAGRAVSRLDRPLRLPRVNPTDLAGEPFARWLDSPT